MHTSKCTELKIAMMNYYISSVLTVITYIYDQTDVHLYKNSSAPQTGSGESAPSCQEGAQPYSRTPIFVSLQPILAGLVGIRDSVKNRV